VTTDEVEAVARQVAALLAASPGSLPLLSAGEVAARLGVERSWVYAHARELGVVRLGDGPRPRLRFDPAVVERLRNPQPPVAPARELLPIRTSRSRRHRRRVGDEERRPRH
jgi:hypothetical protein